MIDSAVSQPTHLANPLGRTALRVAALAVGLCGSGLVGHVLHLAENAQYALISAAWLLAFPVVRAARRANVAAGDVSPASRRYNNRVVAWFFVYVVILMAVHWLKANYRPDASLLWPLALIQALPIVYLVWQNGRYLVDETDEYLKARRVFALLVGTGLVLVATTLWGSLAQAGAVPQVGAVWVFPLWMTGVGIGVLINLWRAP